MTAENLGLNEINLLNIKKPDFKPDDWKILWICILLFFLANTICMSISESKKHRKEFSEMREQIDNLTDKVDNLARHYYEKKKVIIEELPY